MNPTIIRYIPNLTQIFVTQFDAQSFSIHTISIFNPTLIDGNHRTTNIYKQLKKDQLCMQESAGHQFHIIIDTDFSLPISPRSIGKPLAKSDTVIKLKACWGKSSQALSTMVVLKKTMWNWLWKPLSLRLTTNLEAL